MVLQARGPGDVPVSVRNKLYSALGRTIAAADAGKRPGIKPGAIARYKEDKLDKTKMFAYLCEFVEDTSCKSIVVTSTLQVSAEAYDESMYSCHTKHSLMLLNKGYKFKAGAVYVENMIKGVPTKPHPQQPRNKMMKLHKVLTSEIEGAMRSKQLKLTTGRDHDSQGGAAEVASTAVEVADNIGRGIRAEDSNDSEHEYSDGDEELPTEDVKPTAKEKRKGSGKGATAKAATPAQTHSKWMTMLRNIKSAHQKLEKSSARQDKFLTDALKAAADVLDPLVKKLDDAIVVDTAKVLLPQMHLDYENLVAEGNALHSITDDMKQALLRIKQITKKLD